MYEVKIKESSMELTAKQKVMYKDTSDAYKLDDVVKENEPLGIEPIGYVVLSIHNDNSDNPDFEQYVILSADGSKYVTGSDNFFTSFINIWNELGGIETDEAWMINVYKKPSKNFKGKFFLTCSVI